MCWFLSQELAGEAGFVDLVALATQGSTTWLHSPGSLTQVKLPGRKTRARSQSQKEHGEFQRSCRMS